MSRFTLFTYDDVDEFNRYCKELEDEEKIIHNFIFEEIEELLKYEDGVVIDISGIVQNVESYPANINPVIYSFRDLDESSKVIIKAKLADQAIENFSILFKDVKPLYEKSDSINQEDCLIPFKRRILYTYENGQQLNNIIQFADKNEIAFTSFSALDQKENETLKLMNNNKKKVLVDITNISIAVIKKPELIYMVEHALESFQNFDIIIREDIADEALDSYRLLFSSRKVASELLDGISLDETYKRYEEHVIKVTDLSPSQFGEFKKIFSSQLFGHDDFKNEFMDRIDTFRVLNKIKKKKIFSIFILGPSGLGKTEVARIIKRALNNDTSFIKINFGNYSSDEVLNSLIGSPRGYKGMEEGELSIKIKKSKAGIILCDEFEKSTSQVLNFFLELLEDGAFTDSMSEEYDLDGYIIVFTSNLNFEGYSQVIPPELKSRFDLVSDFYPLTREEKIEYVNYEIKRFIEDIKIYIDLPKIPESDMEYFREIDIGSTHNIRDIQRNLQERMMVRLKKYIKKDPQTRKRTFDDALEKLKMDG